jgi:hypothetical protein
MMQNSPTITKQYPFPIIKIGLQGKVRSFGKTNSRIKALVRSPGHGNHKISTALVPNCQSDTPVQAISRSEEKTLVTQRICASKLKGGVLDEAWK